MREHIVEGVFRGGAFAGGIEGFAAQILHGPDGLAVFHHIQHTQGVDGQHLDFPAGIVVERGGGVGRQRGDVNAALGEAHGDFVGHGLDSKGICLAGGAVFGVVHQFDHPHGGGAVQGGHAHTGFCGGRGGRFGLRLRGRRGSSALGRGGAADQHHRCEREAKKKREQFFHDKIHPFCWAGARGSQIVQRRGRLVRGGEPCPYVSVI